MQQKYDSASGGFSLFELIIAMGLGMVVLSGARIEPCMPTLPTDRH